jgi:hypothetical protein
MATCFMGIRTLGLDKRMIRQSAYGAPIYIYIILLDNCRSQHLDQLSACSYIQPWVINFTRLFSSTESSIQCVLVPLEYPLHWLHQMLGNCASFQDSLRIVFLYLRNNGRNVISIIILQKVIYFLVRQDTDIVPHTTGHASIDSGVHIESIVVSKPAEPAL